ncbi:hypothetical protein BCR33DRAFT_751145 [Rhizoclosmatium globosum]|uniref:DDE Tnp4 domain-containing protein n=1 Tax=Rhizoclosmatium globosum TaxID=329046 RepID=A0A1Y2A5U2_9FUNG|nr:hypothetical protein BCR33DRAFT_751145 [Rhizoclosmatium globosum]|eukprot:ORY17876.1 hypothetical protein BCR33DRAFT_751145 [Rhizoclosmatium globosum]
MQAIVDHKMHCISFLLRSGSCSDKLIFNRPCFGQNIHLKIPSTGLFLADAEYQLFQHIMTPYPIYFQMPDDKPKYNYHHSRARMTVKRVFGLFKGRFQTYKKALVLETPQYMSAVITATLVLHNWLIDLDATDAVDAKERRWMHINGDHQRQDERNRVDPVSGDDARAVRDNLKNLIFSVVN